MSMMTYEQIRNMPTVVSEDVPNCHRFHESLCRSYHILEKVKWLLEKKTGPDVITELIALMEGKDGT